MSQSTKKTPAKTKKPRVSKLNVWLHHYLNSANSRTYLNKTESAKAAGYKASSDDGFAQIGYQNFKKLQLKIEQWFDEYGLSENALKIKLVSLLDSEETKFMTLKGEVDEKDLPENAQIITSAKQVKYSADGNRYTERETVIGINVKAQELQRRTLDMAFKVRGSYAPEKREHDLKNVKFVMKFTESEDDGSTG